MEHSSFIDGVRISVDLAARPEVAAAWSDESSCAGMTVGGLTNHLLTQIHQLRALLETDPAALPAGLEVLTAREHYARAAWVADALDGPVNTRIRDVGETGASAGPEAVVARAREALAAAGALLAAPRTPDVVAPSWLAWGLTTDDFLLTRLVETTVHCDDLAASVGLGTPRFSDDVADAVVRLLTDVAHDRHGQTAMLRMLTRPQRAPEGVSAF
ncbi:maleylpyruvate isomerase N-terminal domain-containing protein [Myceligenerans halotolerans]